MFFQIGLQQSHADFVVINNQDGAWHGVSAQSEVGEKRRGEGQPRKGVEMSVRPLSKWLMLSVELQSSVTACGGDSVRVAGSAEEGKFAL